MAKKEYTYEEICRDIVAKKFAPVYIMMGDEPFFMDQITDLLLENVLEESERDFNQIIMYGADTDAASIINAARRFPMMSKYQLVVVREAQLIRDIELLSNYVKNPLMSTVLVINYKYKNLDRRKALASATDKTGVLFESKKIPDYKMPAFIASFMQMRSIGIDGKASQMLSDFLGNDLSRLSKELDKLALILPEKGAKRITPELIIDCVADYYGMSADMVRSDSRKKEIAQARHVAVYLTREMTSLSLPRIGDAFGRDHSTIINSCDKITKQLENQPDMKGAIADLKKIISEK